MKTKDIFMYGLGGLVILCFFVILGLLVFKPIPESNNELLHLAVGALIGMAGAVVTYFYGSSKGSSDKNDIISGNGKT